MIINPFVVDISHHNWDNGVPLDFDAARAAGLVGVIAKASQGGGYRDPTFAKTREMAKEAGLLFGAYHFGTGASVQSQLANFFGAVGDMSDTLLVLDFEKNEQDAMNTMSSEQAGVFLQAISQSSERKATVYTGPFMYEVFGKKKAEMLAPYRVWWARYSDVTDLHPTWLEYWLWQFTDGHNGPKPHKVNGIGFCDVNTYDGSQVDLVRSWLGQPN